MYSPSKNALALCTALGGAFAMASGAAAQDVCAEPMQQDSYYDYDEYLEVDMPNGRSPGGSQHSCDAADIASLAIVGDLAAFRQFRPAFRFGRLSGPEIAGQDGFADEDQGAARAVSVFASISGQNLSGGFDGSSTKLLLGADISLGETSSAGLTLVTSRNTTTPNGGLKLERSETMIGPYFGTQLSENLFLDGFLAFGDPDYEIENVSFSSTKTIGGLTLSGSVATNHAELAPFVSLAGSREKLPGYTVSTGAVAAVTTSTTVLTVGSQVYYNPIDTASALVQPFAGLEVDFANVKDDVNPNRSYRAVRLSGGAIFAFETGGYLEAKVEAAQSSDNYDTVGASLFYGLQF